MTEIGYQGGVLTHEQWRLVQQLAPSLAPAQARWISGFFAGLDAGLLNPLQPTLASGESRGRTLTILYGTETGNGAEVARALAVAADAKGLQASLVDMADYKQRQLGQEQDLVIIASTYGEGDPPQPAMGFFEFVEGRKAPKLSDVRFAVLALGDSTYEFYCEAGKRLDRRFEELGASRLIERVDCDVDYDEPAAAWSDSILALLTADQSETVPAQTAARVAPLPSSTYDKRNPFAAAIIENMVIVGRGSTKETRHIELSLEGSGLDYAPGDALGIAVANDPATVAALLEALGMSEDEPIQLKSGVTTISDALTYRYEITTATPRFLDHWALLSDAKPLRQLLDEDRAGERAIFLRTHHLIDIMRRYPMKGLRAQGFVTGLRPLQPRLYSLASSLAAAPGEAHITLAPVRYTLHGEARSGVASAQFADRGTPDATLPVYVQRNPHFRLPADDVPIVMIGAGTGVAPYRAFLQEREVRRAKGASWLFFGERNFRTDFLYQSEWQAFLKDGVLSRMDVAFSRDRAGRVLVQDRMREQAADLFGWLEDGAHFYVCGDAAHLAPDVHETLIEIVAAQGRTSRDAAEDYVRGLQADHRYQRDVY
ncbi:MAG: assimilatory sulfite reductase (NADPH) flavoprotein subunit [Pseudomonadota bacterium]